MKRPIINQWDRLVARKYPKTFTAKMVEHNIAVYKLRRSLEDLIKPIAMILNCWINKKNKNKDGK